jgi:adenylosuccinate synthase
MMIQLYSKEDRLKNTSYFQSVSAEWRILMVKAIVGANWGDEGKGKITDMLAKEADIIVRFQGGSNAGHTIINNYGKFALHLLPSGVFYGHTTSVIGNGVALNIPYLVNEIKSLVDRGVPMPKIKVSDRAQIMMPYHILFDQYEEERLAGRSFGSTKSGIAPFYSDKYAKIGFQVSELFDEKALKEKIARVCEVKNVILEHLYHKPAINQEDIFNTLIEYKNMIEPYICDVSVFIHDALKEGRNILLEGQLGSLKDPDFGIYPMVTSSSTLAAYGAIGAGIPPYEIKDIIAVVKAYSSAVGAGEFVSEIFGKEAKELRNRGGDSGEYGATTGRPRRMGWFDAVATRYGCRVQGATEAALTVLDVLGYLDELSVCVGYEIDGVVTRDFPTTVRLAKAKPVYKKLPGWKQDIRGIKNYNDLPQNCKNYIEFIEKEIEVPITLVSNGPGRDEIIRK